MWFGRKLLLHFRVVCTDTFCSPPLWCISWDTLQCRVLLRRVSGLMLLTFMTVHVYDRTSYSSASTKTTVKEFPLAVQGTALAMTPPTSLGTWSKRMVGFRTVLRVRNVAVCS